LVAICEEMAVDALFGVGHTKTRRGGAARGNGGDNSSTKPCQPQRFGAAEWPSESASGRAVLRLHKSLRPLLSVEAAGKRGHWSRERSARHIGRAQSGQSETDLFACDAEGLPACVRCSRSRRALSPAVKGRRTGAVRRSRLSPPVRRSDRVGGLRGLGTQACRQGPARESDDPAPSPRESGPAVRQL
jgi:hypothetical protein